MNVATLLNEAVAAGAGASFDLKDAYRMALQAKGVTTSGSGAAVVDVQASNDGVNWLTLGTISLTLGTSETSDGFVAEARWGAVRGYVQSISGTGAKVSLYMGH